MKKLGNALIIFLLTSTVTLAQDKLELGIKGGGTFTHGYTNVAARRVSSNVSIPELQNKGNGIGVGYSAGIWVRKTYNHFFIQIEADYNRFVLKQKTNATLTAGGAASLANITLPPIVPATLPADLAITSQSTLESITVPVLFGHRWANGRYRVYAGPNFMAVRKAETQVEGTATATFNGVSLSVPASRTTDLRESDAGYLEVKKYTFGAEVGFGTTLLKNLDIDLRYGAPVGGVYRSSDITGYMGVATLTVGYKLVGF